MFHLSLVCSLCSLPLQPPRALPESVPVACLLLPPPLPPHHRTCLSITPAVLLLPTPVLNAGQPGRP